MNLYFKNFLSLLVIAFIFLVTLDIIRAQEASQIQPITADISRFNDYYRFSIKSNEYVPFDLEIDGDDVIISFDKPNNLDFGKYIYPNSILRSFGSSGDNKSYVLKLNATGAKVRKFIGDDNTTGFDLYVSNQKSTKKFIMMSSLPDQSGKLIGEIATLEKQKIESNIITYPLNFIGPPKPDQLVKNDDSFVGPLKYDPKKYAVYEIMKELEEGTIIPELAIDEKGMTISFPLTDIDSASTAAMIKGSKITIIFNTTNNIQIGDVIQNPYIKSIKKIPDKKYKILELTFNKKRLTDQYQKAFYKDKSTWRLEVYKPDEEKNKFDVTALDISAENNFGEKRLIANADSIVGPVILNDEDTQNKIVAFLIRDNATGIVLPHEYVDIKLLQTLQGIFLEEKSDFISYDIADKKLVITKLTDQKLASTGLQISDDVISTDTVEGKKLVLASSKIKGVFPENTIFPFPEIEAKNERGNGDKATEEDKNKDEAESDTEEKESKDKVKDKEPTKKAKGKDEPVIDLTTEGEDTGIKDNIIEEKLVEDSIDKKDITNTTLEYVNRIIAADADKKSDVKLELAQLYFAKGLYAESLGMVQDIKQTDPTYKNMFKVDSLIGANDYLTNKYDDALDVFTALSNVGDKDPAYSELRLWQWASKNMFNIKKRNTDEVPIEIDFVSGWDKFMQKYPLNLRYKMGLMYTEEKIKQAKINDAKNLLDIITYAGIPRKYVNDTQFLRGYLADKDGNQKLALKIYENLVKDSNDRKNRARALVELTKSKLLKSQISNDEAINNFMQAATIWRDDYFEMDILEIVGHLYVSQKDYIKALDTWKQIANNFPETTESVFILGKMKQLFIELFDGDIAYKMKPLETLKLYFGFRELTPAGEVGDRITRKVAQFFITADMMDEAIKIIEHQIKYRSTGDEKNKLALWLSDINISNRDLDSAEKALDYIKDKESNPKFVSDKKYKLAYITALRNEYQTALDMVKNDFSAPAQKVRTELFWQKENWFGVMSTIESRLNLIRETKPLPLTKDEMNDINRLIVAYSAQGENKKLAAIKTEFANRIPSESDELLFNYLTRGNKNLDYKNFDSTVELEDIERFLNDYSYLPDETWQSSIKILEPKVELLVGKTSEELSREDKFDVVKLAIAYSMLEPKDEKEANDMKKKLAEMARNFKDFRIDRFTIDAFNIFDDKFMPKENDAVFEGKIKVTDITEFVKYYKSANKFSELNISIRDKFKN